MPPRAQAVLKRLWGVPQRLLDAVSAAAAEMLVFCLTLIIGGRP
jgi:hypothetical protein